MTKLIFSIFMLFSLASFANISDVLQKKSPELFEGRPDTFYKGDKNIKISTAFPGVFLCDKDANCDLLRKTSPMKQDQYRNAMPTCYSRANELDKELPKLGKEMKMPSAYYDSTIYVFVEPGKPCKYTLAIRNRDKGVVESSVFSTLDHATLKRNVTQLLDKTVTPSASSAKGRK